MSKNIQLTIADPCHESWDNMTQAEKGRFCASCQKQVIDFTSMSDSQLAAFFKKPTAGLVCGRFFKDQLERNIEIPKKRIPWVKYFFQFALPAFLVSMKATAQGNVRARVVPRTATVSKPNCNMLTGAVKPIQRSELMGDTILSPVLKQGRVDPVLVRNLMVDRDPFINPVSIKGKVVDENNDPVPFATIMIKGTKIGVMADSAGIFKIERPVSEKEPILQISSVGYETKEIPVSERISSESGLLVQLKTSRAMGEVVVVGYQSLMGKVVMGGAVSGKKIDKVANIPIIKPPTEIPAMIKVYPNPVQAGTSINVGCQKLNEGYYYIQIANQSGQQVLNKQAWIDGDVQVLNIDLPHVASGVYFLRLTNKETNKRFTQKIVIE